MTDFSHGIIGRCDKMRQLFRLMSKLADDEMSTILIRGESGTGKELVAKAIHNQSGRRAKKFVPVNCAAIPDDLLESELFGHTKGAFTGATSAKTGRIEYADGGTLFLDEIGDMKPNLQAKLLRVLQEREFEPVGALKPIPVNVRIIAATHRNLEQMVKEGTFREDLYYRLSVVPVLIPPLRDRREDIPHLLQHFLKTLEKRQNKRLRGFNEEAIRALTILPWHGNVRELENLVLHMNILHEGKTVTPRDLPEKYRIRRASAGRVSTKKMLPLVGHFFDHPTPPPENWPDDGIDFNALVDDFETNLIMRALTISKGNKKEAARLLKLKRTTLLEKIKKKEISLQV